MATREDTRIEFLDGMRGVAALYVMLFHAYHLQVFLGEGRDWVRAGLFEALRVLSMGHYAVDVFIVLSGFVLMIPLVRRGGRLRAGAADFFRRRARRILPPFYAAAALSLLLLPATRYFETHSDAPVWARLAKTADGTVASHIFLLVNVVDGVDIKNNPVLWSVCTECHIYLLFPTLLLPLYRWKGVIWCAAVALVVGIGTNAVTRGQFYVASPWYLGLFALGMTAAVASFSEEPQIAAWRQRIPWAAVATVIYALFLVTGMVWASWPRKHLYVVDPILGVGVMSTLIQFSRYSSADARVPRFSTYRLFTSRWVVGLGLFSYSLYLVHHPVLKLLHTVMFYRKQSLPVTDAMILVVGPLLSIAVAFVFFRVVERPFLTSSSAKAARGATAHHPLEPSMASR